MHDHRTVRASGSCSSPGRKYSIVACVGTHRQETTPRWLFLRTVWYALDKASCCSPPYFIHVLVSGLEEWHEWLPGRHDSCWHAWNDPRTSKLASSRWSTITGQPRLCHGVETLRTLLSVERMGLPSKAASVCRSWDSFQFRSCGATNHPMIVSQELEPASVSRDFNVALPRLPWGCPLNTVRTVRSTSVRAFCTYNTP